MDFLAFARIFLDFLGFHWISEYFLGFSRIFETKNLAVVQTLKDTSLNTIAQRAHLKVVPELYYFKYYFSIIILIFNNYFKIKLGRNGSYQSLKNISLSKLFFLNSGLYTLCFKMLITFLQNFFGFFRIFQNFQVFPGFS